jgi:hypothetical protein
VTNQIVTKNLSQTGCKEYGNIAASWFLADRLAEKATGNRHLLHGLF